MGGRSIVGHNICQAFYAVDKFLPRARFMPFLNLFFKYLVMRFSFESVQMNGKNCPFIMLVHNAGSWHGLEEALFHFIRKEASRAAIIMHINFLFASVKCISHWLGFVLCLLDDR